VQVRVQGYPFGVTIGWPGNQALLNYWHTAPLRLAMEFGSVLLLLGAALGMSRMQRARERDTERLTRLAAFNAMDKQVNRLITDSDDETALMQALCQIAIDYGGLRLAFIARPDATGRFVILASAGVTAYCDGLHLSTDPNVPEGQGSAGRAWREGRSHYNQSIAQVSFMAPWKQRLLHFGLVSSATVLIRKAAQPWGILSVYHAQENVFDDDLKVLLEALAEDVSRGIDQIENHKNEQTLSLQLGTAQAYQRALFDNNAAGLFVVDSQHKLVDVNPALCAMTGYDNAELLGQSTAILHAGDESFRRFRAFSEEALTGHPVVRENVEVRRKDGGLMIAEVLGSQVILPDDTPGVLWSLIDLTALHAAQDQIRYQALHDTLTGLPNRRALDQHLAMALGHARRHGSAVAVGMIDLDDFKLVNDAHGHSVGDRLLQQFSLRMREALRETSIMARPGGDEFVVVIDDLEVDNAHEQLDLVLGRLHRAVETPFELGPGLSVQVHISMGLALFPSDAADGDALLRQADLAMYQIKTQKQNRQDWWRLASAAQPQAEHDLDAYSEEAASLLHQAAVHIDTVLETFIDRFYAELTRSDAAVQIMRNLGEEEMHPLKDKQAEHLRMLLHPETTRAQIEAAAQVLGMVHALVGAGSPLMMQAIALYRGLLNTHLNRTLMPPRERYRLLQATDLRLQDDLQAQLQAAELTVQEYLSVLATPLPQLGTPWTDAEAVNIQALGRL
ncbi:MAG: diguanylate cyclase, partial [Thiomonas sp.]